MKRVCKEGEPSLSFQMTWNVSREGSSKKKDGGGEEKKNKTPDLHVQTPTPPPLPSVAFAGACAALRYYLGPEDKTKGRDWRAWKRICFRVADSASALTYFSEQNNADQCDLYKARSWCTQRPAGSVVIVTHCERTACPCDWADEVQEGQYPTPSKAPQGEISAVSPHP